MTDRDGRLLKLNGRAATVNRRGYGSISQMTACFLLYLFDNVYLERNLAADMSIPINHEETNLEVLARIVKVAARKFDCSVHIDFSNGNRRIEFIGDETSKALIAAEMEYLFDADGTRE